MSTERPTTCWILPRNLPTSVAERRVSTNKHTSSTHINTMSSKININMRDDKSKAFRACLPPMRPDQIHHVERWFALNCALHATFVNGHGKAVLIALKDQERTAASFSRTLRCVLRRFAIDDAHLRGKWVSLLSTEEALVILRSGNEISVGAGGSSDVKTNVADNCTKIVTLR